MPKYYAKVSALETTTDNELPEWYLIFQAGQIDLENGPTYTVDKASYDAVVAHFTRRGLEPPVDYEHQTLSGEEAPAAGWIKEWRWDESGISARIEWTERAAERIKSKEYRYFSPVFELTELDGQHVLTKVHNVALTNDPRTNNIQPLVAKRGQQEVDALDFIAKLIAITGLGLTEGASEEQVLEAVLAKVDNPDKPDPVEVIPAKVTTALGLGDNSTVEVIVAKIDGLKNTASNGGELAREVATLKDQLAEQQAEKLVAKYDDRITPAMTSKMGEGENFNWLWVLAKNDATAFEAMAKTMPVQIPGKLPGLSKTGDGGENELSPEDEIVMTKMGLTKDQFLGKEKGEGK